MPTLPSPVNEVYEATNTGDLPRFVAAFAADGVVDDSGRAFHGHDAIARWSRAESIGVQQTFTATGTRNVGEHTIVTATVGGGGCNGPATFTFVLTPGRDRSAATDPPIEGASTVQQQKHQQPVKPWAPPAANDRNTRRYGEGMSPRVASCATSAPGLIACTHSHREGFASIREGHLKLNETPADLTPEPLWVAAVMGRGSTRTLIEPTIQQTTRIPERCFRQAPVHSPHFPPERQYLDHILYPSPRRHLEPREPHGLPFRLRRDAARWPRGHGSAADRDGALAVLREAVELGITHIDTSDYYGPRITNEIIREALHPYSESLHIVTKVGGTRDAQGGWPVARQPEDLRRAVHDNLGALGLETLDVVNLRLGNAEGPEAGSIAEPFEALVELQKEGLIRHLGVSNATVEQVAQALAIAPIVCVQNMYNLAFRQDDALVGMLAQEGIAYVPFFPLGGFSPLQSETLSAVASRLDATPMSVALAWLLQRSPNILLIPGTSSITHLHENVRGAGLSLSVEDLAELDKIGR